MVTPKYSIGGLLVFTFFVSIGILLWKEMPNTTIEIMHEGEGTVWIEGIPTDLDHLGEKLDHAIWRRSVYLKESALHIELNQSASNYLQARGAILRCANAQEDELRIRSIVEGN